MAAARTSSARRTKPSGPPAHKPSIAERMATPPPYSRALVTKQLARVRKLCTALPEAFEKISHGSPCFFVPRGGQFVAFLDNHHGDGRLALWCAAPAGAQAMLVDANPEVYFVPPYVGHRGWVGVRLDRDAPWPQIANVIEAAHQARHQPPRARRPRDRT
jgi:hypothetical protein